MKKIKIVLRPISRADAHMTSSDSAERQTPSQDEFKSLKVVNMKISGYSKLP